jgi:hypothetical protein
MALRAASMAHSDSACGLWLVTRRRKRQDQRDSGVALGLLLLADYALIAPRLHNSLGHRPLSAPGVHRAYPALQHERGPDGLTLRDRMGFVVHHGWRQRQAHEVRQGRQQMDAWRALLARAAQRCASKRHGGFARRWSRG